MLAGALACPFTAAAMAREIAPDDLAALPSAGIVVLGEVHDNPHHHANQAAAIAALAPAALVFEMLTPDQALRVTPQLRGDAAALGAAPDWEASGWPDFGMYHPLFAAAPSAAVYGAAVTPAELSRAVTEGAAAVFGADAARFGLAAALLPDELAERIAEQAEAHCHALPEAMLPGMVEAQRLRDAGLARAALAALEQTGGPVAVVTGNGHARTDRGAPSYLAAAAPEARVLALGQFEAAPEGEVPYDLWLVTAPAERSDPCAAFGGG